MLITLSINENAIMTLNKLRYIVAVSQEGNFRRAAERVFVSQPALSLAILWIATGANLLGLRVGKWLGNIGGAATYLAAAVLVVGGVAAWIARGGPATKLDLFPPLDAEKLNFWPQIFPSSSPRQPGASISPMNDLSTIVVFPSSSIMTAVRFDPPVGRDPW